MPGMNTGFCFFPLFLASLWPCVFALKLPPRIFSAGLGYAMLFEARLNGWLNDGKLLMRLVTADLERLDGCGRHWSNGE